MGRIGARGMNRPDIAGLDNRVRDIYRELYELVQYTLHIESRLAAAHRAMVKIAVMEVADIREHETVDKIKMIANDALAAWERGG